ncbi:MAG: hypothetical protein CSA62_09640 [Planctomycetota bacterium]|nr:MAG: hypothetical protein CSA62_09640 [Planctomycetota bacterium]
MKLGPRSECIQYRKSLFLPDLLPLAVIRIFQLFLGRVQLADSIQSLFDISGSVALISTNYRRA